jgi:hypothetical protein
VAGGSRTYASLSFEGRCYNRPGPTIEDDRFWMFAAHVASSNGESAWRSQETTGEDEDLATHRA